ncbi:MAG: ABC transporter ATP-binding protein [Nitrospiraceae bacterium]|nr:ABC transporter ATP-binding protein [Nitrospiraceae bacterium]
MGSELRKDMPVLQVTDLSKDYMIDDQRLKAVDNVSFTADRGEMISIVGHSGSGKTTLLSLIGGLTKPDRGRVLIDGTDLWALDDRKRSELRSRRVSFIYQFSSLIPTLTALENIILPTTFGDFSADVEQYARELLGIVGLEDKARSYPSHLSGGQQRRIAIARAFINNPEIVLADEPTGDLDEETEQQIIALFKRMNGEKKVTFIIVTHNREIADRTSRQMRMSNGVLVAQEQGNHL